MAVRFKLDENLPRDAEALMRLAGHDVETVLSERLGGGPDPTLLDVCRNEDRILVTLDLGFSDVRAYPPASHPGIWVLRPSSQSTRRTLAVLKGALKLMEIESPQNRLWVVDETRVRIRD